MRWVCHLKVGRDPFYSCDPHDDGDSQASGRHSSPASSTEVYSVSKLGGFDSDGDNIWLNLLKLKWFLGRTPQMGALAMNRFTPMEHHD